MSPAPSVPSTAPPGAALLYSPARPSCDAIPGYYLGLIGGNETGGGTGPAP